MRPKAYIETTGVSYLTALPSRDLVLAAHQQVTRDWWITRDAFELFVSQFVMDEASAGNAAAAELRVAALRDVVLLDLTPDATRLAAALIRGGGVPEKARIDALHIGVASVRPRHGLSCELELHPYRKCDDARADRSNLSRCGLRPARHLHATRVSEGTDAMNVSNSIIDEVRAAREAIAKESDDDLDKIVEAARVRQSASGREIVTFPPKKADSAKRAS